MNSSSFDSAGAFGEEEENDVVEESESINGHIMMSLSELSSHDDDFPSYKAKTKKLLEHLLSKLEEDVDYQRSLESQIEDLEISVMVKDRDMQRLSEQAREAIDDCKLQAEEMSEDMLGKIATEVNQRISVERLLVRLQLENSKLKNDVRLLQQKLLAKSSPKSQIEEIEKLKEMLSEARREADSLRRQREMEMNTMLSVISQFGEKLKELNEKKKIEQSAQGDDTNP